MADDARELVAQAKADAEAGAMGAALRALDRAYVPVQKPRDLPAVREALALARRIGTEASLSGRERRRARSLVESYEELERSYSSPHAQAAAALPPPRVRALPSLEWIDALVVVLGCFAAAALAGGLAVLVAANTRTDRVAGIAAGAFWATMLVALIAVLRLLQRIEHNSRPGGKGPAN